MSATKQIKKVMIDKNIKSGTLAELFGQKETQTFYNRLSRDTWKYSDVEKIADLLGCDLLFVDRETGKTY